MRVPSRSPGVPLLALVAALLAGCGGSDAPSPPAGSGTPDPALRGIEARRERAPVVLREVERIAGPDAISDLTFDRRRFTVLTSWVTAEEHARPANALQEEADVLDRGKIGEMCRAIARIDPGADAFVAGYDGTSWREPCPQTLDDRRSR